MKKSGVCQIQGDKTKMYTNISSRRQSAAADEDDVRQVYPNNTYDEQNLQIALRLHRAILEHTGSADRGMRRARFMGVLQKQHRPALPIEGGYLSNFNEARRIATAEYRQLLAEAVASAIQSFSKPPMRLANEQAKKDLPHE